MTVTCDINRLTYFDPEVLSLPNLIELDVKGNEFSNVSAELTNDDDFLKKTRAWFNDFENRNA